MLENWLSPLDSKEFEPVKSYARGQIGRKVNVYYKSLPNLEKVKIAIVGFYKAEANSVRRQLYQLEFPFRGLSIVDLGNVRNQNHSFLITIVKELLDSNIIPIIIGSDIKHSIAQYQAYHLKKHVNLVAVDEKIWMNPSKNEKSEHNYISEIYNKRKPVLFNLGIIAYQNHFTNKRVISKLVDENHDLVRLGDYKSNPTEIEPLIRYADLMTFNISALKQLEAPAQFNPSPSGLFSEEACQLCRYAGLSDRLTSIGFYGFDANKKDENLTAKTIAQLIWYFIYGFSQRKKDYPASTAGLTEYIVERKEGDEALIFWKSGKSGRWWIEVPIKGRKKRTEMVPCSHEDYKQACNNELSPRVLRAFEKLY